MTNPQIILFIFIAIVSIISFTVNVLSKNKMYSAQSSAILLVVIITLFLMLFATLSEINKYKGKCPEYEKIDNVYKLK